MVYVDGLPDIVLVDGSPQPPTPRPTPTVSLWLYPDLFYSPVTVYLPRCCSVGQVTPYTDDVTAFPPYRCTFTRPPRPTHGCTGWLPDITAFCDYSICDLLCPFTIRLALGGRAFPRLLPTTFIPRQHLRTPRCRLDVIIPGLFTTFDFAICMVLVATVRRSHPARSTTPR